MKQPTIIDHIIACNIKKARKARGISLKDAATKIGVSYQQLRKYETGDNRITAGKLWQLSIVYRIPVQKFFQKSDDEA